MIIRNIKMYYLSDYELGAIENADLLPNEGIKVLAYNRGEFLGGAIYDSDIPRSYSRKHSICTLKLLSWIK